MGVVPFDFEEGTSWQTLGLKGDETVTIRGIAAIAPRRAMTLEITGSDGSVRTVPVRCRIDTLDELEYLKNGGILHYVLRNLAAA
jgi:aconitate hydratase